MGAAVECLQARAAAHAVRMAGVSAKRRKQLEAHLHAHGGVVGTAAVTADIEAKERAAAAAAVGARAKRAPAVPCGKAPDGRKSPKTRTRKRRRGRGRPLSGDPFGEFDATAFMEDGGRAVAGCRVGCDMATIAGGRGEKREGAGAYGPWNEMGKAQVLQNLKARS